MSHTASIQLTQNSTYKLNNGLQIPVAAFGVYQLPAGETAPLVVKALEDGYRHIDTAEYYGNQAEVAQGIAQFLKSHPDVTRQDIWFTTKITNEDHGYDKTIAALKKISNDVTAHIEYVDLVLIHSPKTTKELRLETWRALQDVVSDPNSDVLKIKAIGVSNFGIKHLEELFAWDGLVVQPQVDQIEVHPWLPQVELRKYLVEKDIVAEAYSPLTQGKLLNCEQLLELEKKYKVSKIEMLLKWSYLQGLVVICKTSNPDRIKQNLNYLPARKIDDELAENAFLGKVDLNPDLLAELDMPESHEVCCWGGVDPTLYVDPK